MSGRTLYCIVVKIMKKCDLPYISSHFFCQVVRRGVPQEYQMEIPRGESEVPDHLVFVVHGIGIYSDLSYR